MQNTARFNGTEVYNANSKYVSYERKFTFIAYIHLLTDNIVLVL